MKNTIKIIAAILILTLLLTACAVPDTAGSGGGGITSGGDTVTAGLPSDVPEDFAIRFVAGIGAPNIYDTYTGTIQKDLIVDGVAEANFSPDEQTLRNIYAKVVEYDICSIGREMTSDVLAGDGFGYGVDPLTVYEITVTAYGKTYTIHGDATAEGFVETDKDADHFMSFVRFMYDILYNNPEYQSLPDAVGGYD